MTKSSDLKSQVNRSRFELDLITFIQMKTDKKNIDNIARTKAYLQYFLENREVKWSFLASMVSRNAGWNMNDLHLKEFREMLSPDVRRSIFLTYEMANWLIFSDAYPQLLLYEASKKENKPLFHLLSAFNVSKFMEREWLTFWNERDSIRLNHSLIINEQNVIQRPIIEASGGQPNIFSSLPFWMQDRFHFSTVLFPTLEGDLYGLSVYGFKNVKNRITLGKKLLKLLSKPELFHNILRFATMIEPIGSRNEYERLLDQQNRRGHAFPLRLLVPIISHQREALLDWSRSAYPSEKWFRKVSLPVEVHLNDWYEKKRLELHFVSRIKSHVSTRKADS